MPRKTKAEIDAIAQKTEPDSLLYWQKERTKEQTRSAKLQSEHRQILIDREKGNLIPKEEVREMFLRVFGAYRQATKEIARRYGQDAAAILIQAERSALRVQQEDDRCKKPRSGGKRSEASKK